MLPNDITHILEALSRRIRQLEVREVGGTGGGGGGDMTKAIYDPDHDNIVENADYASSAGNADTVDGSHAAAFALTGHAHAGAGDMTKAAYDPDTDNIVESADYAATAGDADTVDGSHAAAFALVGHTHVGMGDMTKAVYDTDNDNVVESADYAATAGDADTVDGQHASAFVPTAVLTNTNEPTGFISRSTSTISFNDGTLTFTIAPTGANFQFYSAGTLYTKTAQTKVIANTVNLHYIYFDTSGVIQESVSVWDLNSANVPVACVYWNGSAGLLMDERHGIQMDGMTHEYLHETHGPGFAFGMAGTFAADGSTIAIGSGEWYDDDIEYVVGGYSQCRVMWKIGSAWNWTAAQNQYFHAVAGAPQWNNAGALAAVTVSRYSISWVFATNHVATPIIIVMGQSEHNTQAQAEAVTPDSLVLGTLPAAEMLLLYKVVWQVNGAVITRKSVADYRRLSGGPVSNYTPTDHGSLAGLTDPDHPASAITADTTAFGGMLSASDNTVQKALDTLDDHTHPPAAAAIEVQNNGSSVGTEPALNFIPGANIALGISDDVPNTRVNITISGATGASGAIDPGMAVMGLLGWA